jgi:dienelactone hydrolase
MKAGRCAFWAAVSIFLLGGCAAGAGGAAAGAAAGDIGVVLMHGKWGTPDRHIGDVAGALARSGYRVENVEMPWSRTRLYDKSYDAALVEVDEAVARLRARGARRVVVGGHSLGANAALAYGASRDGVAGVMALAPGHTPERFAARLGDSLAKAKAMVAEGRGDSTAGFEDINQGERRTVSVRARIYLSYFDPDGPAVMPRNTANLKPAAALLWVVGTRDPLFARGAAYAFADAPANPVSRYVVVPADHLSTPAASIDAVLAWLAALP